MSPANRRSWRRTEDHPRELGRDAICRWRCSVTRIAAAAVLVGALAVFGCDPATRFQVLGTLFDGVPQPGETPPPRRPFRQRREPRRQVQVAQATPTGRPTPVRKPIELAEKWEEAYALLPKYEKSGVADWIAAVEAGVITPAHPLVPEGAENAAMLPAEPVPIPANAPTKPYAAFFPHVAHALWLSCPNCHPAIFPMTKGETRVSMAKIFAGEQCGRCHGKVAFAPATTCVQCHPNLPALASEPLPAQASSVGDIAFSRAAAAAKETAEIPGAVFPHWFHRIRFRCDVCHPAIFEMKKGAHFVTMDDIREGKLCGVCHNGDVAFGAAFDTCAKCHLTD